MKKYIMANWKMNKNFSDIPDYIEDLKSNAGDLENVVVCVPSVMLKDFSDKSAGKFGVGAQNCHFADMVHLLVKFPLKWLNLREQHMFLLGIVKEDIFLVKMMNF